jgi:hypothetical protein
MVHNAPVELPLARSFLACAPHFAQSFSVRAPPSPGPSPPVPPTSSGPSSSVPPPPPPLVLYRALPSPTPQNTPQGTGANGIIPER